VGPGGSIGTKKTCTIPAGTLTFAATNSGAFTLYIDPTTCALDAQIQTGLTAAATNFNVSTVANPTFPLYSYTTNSGTPYNLLNVLTVGSGVAINGSISYSDQYGLSPQDSEGGIGLHTGSGPGPFMVVNNYISGAGVTGVFLSDDLTDGSTPCGTTYPCPIQYNTGQLTEQRNTITTNPCYFSGSSCWNGGNYSWRNMDEVKQGKWVFQDGNIWGPYYAQIAQGECGASHYTYNGGNIVPTGYPMYTDSSEWTFTNNTCYQTAAGGTYTGLYYYAQWPALPIKNIRIHNNLFYNTNAYAQTSPLQPIEAQVQQSNTLTNCPYGKIAQWGGNGQNFVFDHNTIYGQGGCLTWFESVYQTLSTGTMLTNNIYNLVSDPGAWNAVLQTGTFFQPYSGFGGTPDIPADTVLQGTALFSVMNNFIWAGNVILATWTNSFPGSQVEYTNSQIATAQALFPTNTYWPSAGSSLSARINQLGWFDPANGNFRLKSTSPYISGARASTDGLDVGVDMDALEAAQGKVSNVHTFGSTSTSTTVGFLAPDSFGCAVDWGTTNFAVGSGSFRRVANAGGQRVQNVALSGLPADTLIYYRVDCAVQQPPGTVKLP
jgi:hypothetical protein